MIWSASLIQILKFSLYFYGGIAILTWEVATIYFLWQFNSNCEPLSNYNGHQFETVKLPLSFYGDISMSNSQVANVTL